MQQGRLIGLAALIGGMAACVGVGANQGGPGTSDLYPEFEGISEAQFLEEYPIEWCVRDFACPGLAGPQFDTMEECLENQSEDSMAVLDDPACDYNEEAAEACVAEQVANAQDCSLQATGVCFGVCAR